MGIKKLPIFSFVLSISFLILFSSCAEKEEPSVLEIKRLQARNEVQNLMGKFAFYHTSGMNFRSAEQLFTTYRDTVIELPWGRYTGNKAAHRAFAVGYRKDDQYTINALKINIPALTPAEEAIVNSSTLSPQNESTAPAAAPSTGGAPVTAVASDSTSASGLEAVTPTEVPSPNIAPVLRVNGLTTPVIEVAGDCETARAVWLCPGLESTTPTWTKYACDFKKQDGEWKIWHLHAYGLTTGLEIKESFTPRIKAENGADKPPTTSWEYSGAAKYIPLEPEPPKPYATWDYLKMEPKSYGDPE